MAYTEKREKEEEEEGAKNNNKKSHTLQFIGAINLMSAILISKLCPNNTPIHKSVHISIYNRHKNKLSLTDTINTFYPITNQQKTPELSQKTTEIHGMHVQGGFTGRSHTLSNRRQLAPAATSGAGRISFNESSGATSSLLFLSVLLL